VFSFKNYFIFSSCSFQPNGHHSLLETKIGRFFFEIYLKLNDSPTDTITSFPSIHVSSELRTAFPLCLSPYLPQHDSWQTRRLNFSLRKMPTCWSTFYCLEHILFLNTCPLIAINRTFVMLKQWRIKKWVSSICSSIYVSQPVTAVIRLHLGTFRFFLQTLLIEPD